MRFVDFLRAAVLLCAGAATALAVVTVAQADVRGEPVPALISIVWWVLTGVVGISFARRDGVSPSISRLLAAARPVTTMPEHRPGLILLNRLWALLIYTLVSAGLGVLAPQIAGIATGLPLVLALSLLRQDRAVSAIEERDGVRFFVRRTSPLRAIALERAPGFTAVRPEQLNGAAR